MTPEAVQAYNALDNALYDEATEILVRLIKLRQKYNVGLHGLSNYSFDRLSEPDLVYTASRECSVFYIPIEALYNPDAYFDKKEAEFIHNAEMDRKLEAFMMTPENKRHNALAKLTTEEKQLLGLL